MYRQYIYLVNKADGNGLTQVSYSEFAAIRNGNADLSVEQRHFFIYDYILDDNTLDCIIMEAPREMYLSWLREHIAQVRNWKAGRQFRHISMDACSCTESENPQPVIVADSDLEAEACWRVFLDNLRDSLSEWKPWAAEMLDLFETEAPTAIPGILAEKLGVSPQMVRRYRRQFRTFVENAVNG